MVRRELVDDAEAAQLEARRSGRRIVEPIPLRDLRPWALLAGFLIAAIYLVTLDQGALSRG